MRTHIAIATTLIMFAPALEGRALASSPFGDPSTHRGPPPHTGGIGTPENRSLDGQGNNLSQQKWGVAGTPYRRIGAPNYADGVSKMVNGPQARWVSNRIFNDLGQNLFSENGVTQWGWVWGQFLDHDMGL